MKSSKGEKKRKLWLIHPSTIGDSAGYGETKAWGMPPLGLGYVAALTPEHWDVKIIDEHVEDIPEDETPDLVGMSTYSLNAPRAYQISGKFREKGIVTVFGGIHASMVPEEASKYADVIVSGEAESVWGKVISDFEQGTLKKMYTAERLPLKDLPIPRRDLFSEKYEMDIIQTTRGCPFNCEFCSVAAFNGAEYRLRPINEVLDEMGTIENDFLYIIDDNLIGVGKAGENRAMELFKGIIDRKIKKFWGTQVSINFADNDELLKYAYKSGCRSVYIGFESIVLNSLKEMKKGINVKTGIEGFKKAIKKIHKNGICVVGAFILGNDNDDVKIFRKMHEFMKEVDLDVLSLGCLTPLPGTRLFDRLKEEDRIIYKDYPKDWERYDTDQVVIKPKNMSVGELARGYQYLMDKRFSRRKIFYQCAKTFWNTKDLISALFAYNLNKGIWEYLVNERDLDRKV